MRTASKRIVAGLIAFFFVGVAPVRSAEPTSVQVLFICEHGYAKSLMAASYFDQLAKARGLPFRGLSRGSAPNSTTVPEGIVAALRSDGVDIGDYRPLAVSAADVASSRRVITIGTTLPASAVVPGMQVEHWNDVPPPLMYDASRAALKAHIDRLVAELASSTLIMDSAAHIKEKGDD